MVIVIVTDFLAFVFDDTHKNEGSGNHLIYFSNGIRKCVYSFLYVKKEKKEVNDPMIQGLLESRRRTEEMRKLLTNPELTAFYFVTLPLALPISVVERFIYWVKAFQIPVGGVIVNQVMPHTDSTSPFIVNKQAEQKHYLELIDKKFGELVVSRIPMFDGEIRGVEMLRKVIS